VLPQSDNNRDPAVRAAAAVRGDKGGLGDKVNLHTLNPDTQCPSCGQASLVYMRSRMGGDIYRCAVERGGCERTVKHRRMPGSAGCRIATVVRGAQTGPWLPCPALAPKGK
jgi:hypothetical protein